MKEEVYQILEDFADSRDIREKLKIGLSDSLEIKCFEFYFNKGDIRPNIEQISPDGKITGYPDISTFSEEDWIYIEKRVSESKNLFLKARYTHLLYKRSRHNDPARQAAEYYYELCQSYISNKPDPESYLLFCECLECYIALSVAAKHELKECKEKILQYVRDERLPFSWKDNVAEMILRWRLFKKKNIDGLTAFMISEIPSDPVSYTLTEMYLQTCLKLAAKESVNNKPIYRLLGENELKLADIKSKENQGIVASHAYQLAAGYFKLGKSREKEQEALSKLTKQKQNIGLTRVSFEIPARLTNAPSDDLNSLVDFLLSKDLVFPFLYLVENKHILKDEADLEKEAAESLKNSGNSFFTLLVFDINANHKSLTDDEKLANEKNQIYGVQLQWVYVLMDKLFYEGLTSGKITAVKIIEFFNQNWFSQVLQGYRSSDEEAPFSWMELLGPGLFNLLSQLEASYLDKNFMPNFQLAIDSLSVKMEGMIRDLARLSGIPVTKIGKQGTEEMNLDDLLREKEITDLFEPKDVYLWKFIFTKTGWNLRNNVAHAFFRPKGYTKTKAMLVLLSIFRMCKYGYLVKQQESEK